MPKFGSDLYPLSVEVGELALVAPDGRRFQPAACGDHRSVPLHNFASDDPEPQAEGFQADCDACAEQCTVTADYAYIRRLA